MQTIRLKRITIVCVGLRHEVSVHGRGHVFTVDKDGKFVYPLDLEVTLENKNLLLAIADYLKWQGAQRHSGMVAKQDSRTS